MRIAAVVFVLCLSGCAAYDDLPLLDIEAIEPPQVEPGGTLRIHGDSFPLGRPAIVRLRGALHRPGAPASTLDARLPGEVQTETLIEVPIDAELIDSIGGRATLDGRLRLAFRASNDRRDIFAEHAVLIDFLPDTSAQLRRDSEGAELAVDARHFGITLSREESGTVGVRVESVEPDSFAATQKLRPGDTLVGLDGVRLYSWRDFRPDPSETESRVLATRAGLSGVHALRWPHEATERRTSSLAFGVLLLLGILLGWMSPIPLGFGARSSTSIAVRLTRLSLVLVFVAALFRTSALQWTTVWIALLGLLSALLSLNTRDRSVVTSFAFAVLSILTVMVLARTASIESIVAVQEGTVSDWYAFRTPASTLAFGSYLYALHPLAGRNRLSASLFSAAAAVLGAALFLGGWETAEPMVGILRLVVKAGAVLVIARLLEIRREVAITLLCLGLSLALLAAWAGLDALPPYWSPLALGSLGVLLVRAFIPALRRPSVPAIA